MSLLGPRPITRDLYPSRSAPVGDCKPQASVGQRPTLASGPGRPTGGRSLGAIPTCQEVDAAWFVVSAGRCEPGLAG